MAEEREESSACCNCHCPLGDEAGELPVTVDDETWCPQCFAWKRAPMEPARFAGAVRAVKCGGKCGLASVAFAAAECGQCGSRAVVELPPKADA